ncbi:MAG: efflux RND transporter periplasmic adaptor subunit [Gammaproteobacteria bacterium]|nr:efflux RND transporter periplasmic adaptor subunit [Gammaproteobacteria bacterium]MBU2223850.1 efflux RND transporter periplasmic adaptor subunit [Gammaproteobacteria bacterium]MBU2277821.1 efflux RND transporter periplasmic adaptor subunit [Gammaproteobacteria bacterium]MBU2427826.1 efflux RND transporter periplasmic adaptor subunit [Gammaproteobacteria bacterium]
MPQQPTRIILVILAALLGFITYVWLSNGTEAPKMRGGNNEITVKTAIIASADLKREVKTLGTALAYDSAKIVTATSDYLTLLHINEGQPVKKGQLLAQLNDTEEKARVNELKALLNEQKRQLARLKNLTRTQASAISLLDEQQAKVNATQAQLEAVLARLSEMQIKAPFDGVLGLRQVSEGAFISTGTVLTTLDDISVIRVEFNVSEHYIADLKVDMPLAITNVAYGQTKFVGKIKAMDPRLDPVTRSIKVHGTVDNSDLRLRPGMLLNVTVELANTQVLQVPENAIVPLQNRQYVFVVGKDDSVKQVEITLGQRVPGSIEVLSGLAEGDEVIVEGTQKLRTGMIITRVGQ